MKDYTQYQEQRHWLKRFPEGFNGRLLEIGAWNAEDKSNSRALIELGWEAVLVEVSPGPLRGLVEYYGKNPKVKIVAGAASPATLNKADLLSPGFFNMQITDDATSTDNPRNFAIWESKVPGDGKSKFIGNLWTLGIPIYELMGPPLGTVEKPGYDFVSVDTEGSSIEVALEVLRQHIDYGCTLPLICIEHDSRWEVVDYLKANYKMVEIHRSEANIILEPAK